MTSSVVMRNARKRAGLTQTELARRVGKTQSEIARWERGDVKPSFETLQRVVRGCGLELVPQIAEADDSYDVHIDRMLALSPLQRVQRAAEHATALRRMRALAHG